VGPRSRRVGGGGPRVGAPGPWLVRRTAPAGVGERRKGLGDWAGGSGQICRRSREGDDYKYFSLVHKGQAASTSEECELL
jgi:hypothetical protein